MYNIYLEQTFIVPICVIIFIFIVFCGASYRFVRMILRKAVKFPDILWYVTVLAGVVGLTFVISSNLVNGGIALSQETEDDVLVAQGYISNIYSPSNRILGFKEGAHRGADILIDREQYFVASAEDFEVGDYIEIWYLPQSRFILRMIRVLGENEE